MLILLFLCVEVLEYDMCTRPLTGYLSRTVNPSGKRSVVFNVSEGLIDKPVQFPCGQCMSCRLEKSRQWALRCVAESKLWDNNIFLTLTYDDSHVPFNGSLVKRDLQLFIKRLRFRFGAGIRYYAAGEYGTKNLRPHYHLIVFNFRPSDAEPLPYRKSPLFISPSLFQLWPFGFHSFGDVTFESAAYVARYCMKKITGADADQHYHGREPEFAVMSLKPGIGYGWIEKNMKDVYPRDEVIMRDKMRMFPPKFFDRMFERLGGDLDKIKASRKLKAYHNFKNSMKASCVNSLGQDYLYNKCFSDLYFWDANRYKEKYQDTVNKRKDDIL